MKAMLKCRMKPYIQPFERSLALQELSAITGVCIDAITLVSNEAPYDFEVLSEISRDTLVDKLTYWEIVCDGEPRITKQVSREATVNIVRNGISPEQIAQLVPFVDQEIPLPNRRCLRYGTHGIHEYRGKFFPQLVRALINIAKVPSGGIVADPMLGSGTTITEAILADCYGLGLDMNPLSVLMSQTKCNLLSVKPNVLASTYRDVRETLLSTHPTNMISGSSYFETLPSVDQEYLTEWFSKQVLFDLDQIARVVFSLERGPIQDLMRISLSNIIRQVSWQKEDDLRVRKEIRLEDDIDPVKDFLEESGRSIRTILAFLYQIQDSKLGAFNIQEGDARECGKVWSKWIGKVDTVITSPPYATALPYLDTDRLSLCYLGLISRSEHRQRDQEMIGNREITERVRKAYWSLFQAQKINLPESIVNLIEKVEFLNANANVGFRRRNLSALLTKYFLDMQRVFSNINSLLKPGAFAYVVVGNNHTIAGGERVEIETASLLVDVALAVGLQPQTHIPMEMLVSRDIFKKNAMASETILSFRRSAQ